MKKIPAIVIIIFICLFMARCSSSASLSGGSKQSIAKVSDGQIIIDGEASDWQDIAPLISNVGSFDRGDRAPDIDIKSVKAAYDEDNLYILLEAMHVGAGIACIEVDSDGDSSTGVALSLKELDANFSKGWDYIIKLTYSFSADREPMLISQIEKYKKIKHGYKSELVFDHRDNIEDPSYVGATSRYQELSIPLYVLGIVPPQDIGLMFVEGTGMMFTNYNQHCRAIKAKLE